jgi:hypothetical protein
MFHFRTGNSTKWGDRTLTPSENPAAEASRYLAPGRIIITAVAEDQVRTTTRGEGAIYSVTYDRYVWACTHPARTARWRHLVAIRRAAASNTDRAHANTGASGRSGGCTADTFCARAPAATGPSHSLHIPLPFLTPLTPHRVGGHPRHANTTPHPQDPVHLLLSGGYFVEMGQGGSR